MTPSSLAAALRLAFVAVVANACERPAPPARAREDVAASTPTPGPWGGPTVSPEQAVLPLPPAPKVDRQRAKLGARLFSDKSISADKSVACATCHPLDRGGADGLSHSRGVGGAETALNTPTIYNATYNFRFNWNGQFPSLQAEFDAPVTKTMKTSWLAIRDKLEADPTYRAAFAAAYPDGVSEANVKDALARYIDTLVTPNAPFDQYLNGDLDALNVQERRGYESFVELGCSTCHQGANIGGNLFQRIGVMRDYFRERVENGGPQVGPSDDGRFTVTKNPADRHVFRVPSLRNVALTPPYFHDGSAPTLEHAVKTMARVQLGRTLSPEQVDSIVAFLETLTGTVEPGP
jgi:cytochrome c peroxidase